MCDPGDPESKKGLLSNVTDYFFPQSNWSIFSLQQVSRTDHKAEPDTRTHMHTHAHMHTHTHTHTHTHRLECKVVKRIRWMFGSQTHGLGQHCFKFLKMGE